MFIRWPGLYLSRQPDSKSVFHSFKPKAFHCIAVDSFALGNMVKTIRKSVVTLLKQFIDSSEADAFWGNVDVYSHPGSWSLGVLFPHRDMAPLTRNLTVCLLLSAQPATSPVPARVEIESSISLTAGTCKLPAQLSFYRGPHDPRWKCEWNMWSWLMAWSLFA